MRRMAEDFNDTAPRPVPKKVKDVLYRFLSGLNQARVGGNTSILEIQYEDDSRLRCMVDPGDLFGDNKNLEHPQLVDCDAVIADMRDYFPSGPDDNLKPAKKPLDMILLSHSHRDHIGAISKMMLMGYKMPLIFATPYTKQRLYQHLNNENIPPQEWPRVKEIAAGQTIRRDGVDIGFFSVSHSTPQSVGIAFKTDEGTIVHSCDWKPDKSLIWGPGFDEQQYKRIVGDKVSLLLVDSTGADSDKKPVTEHDFRETLRDLFAQYKNKRFVMATLAGCEENMASAAKVAAEHGKTLFLDSWSHDQVLSALHETGLNLEDHIRQPLRIRSLNSAKNQREFADTPPQNSIVMVAGVMGQRNSSLVRAAFGRSKTLELDPKRDIILLCGPNMPGQDKENKYALIHELERRGFTVMGHPDHKLYPHAHGRAKEIVALAKLTAAKAVIPVHGNKHLRDENQALLSTVRG
ncbi:MAG: MBL fold metallo-hydrolase, partial [Pseudomonadota bacterium]